VPASAVVASVGASKVSGGRQLFVSNTNRPRVQTKHLLAFLKVIHAPDGRIPSTASKVLIKAAAGQRKKALVSLALRMVLGSVSSRM
jgi:hypothetical protein